MFSSHLKAQTQTSFRYMDSLSYSQYLSADWDAVIKTSKLAFHNGIDYYYMRMRAGIAYYENHSYFQAEKQFKKAEKFNNYDKINKEYIYYSKLFSGKQKGASLYYNSKKEFLKDKLNISEKSLSSFTTDIVYRFPLQSDYGSLINDSELTGLNGSYLLTKNMMLANFKLVHKLNKNLDLIHGGTFLRKDSYLYIKNEINSYEADVSGISQIQYYAGMAYTSSSDFNLTGSIHLLYYSFPSVSIRERGMGSSSLLNENNDNSFSARLSASQYISLFNLTAGLSYSNLNLKNQFQKDITIKFYPLGNINLYSNTCFFHLTEKNPFSTENYMSIKQTIGFKLSEKLWMELLTQQGEIQNYNDLNGFSIYNNGEVQTKRYDISFIKVGNKANIRIMASYNESYSNFYNSDLNVVSNPGKIEINALNIIGEIKWNF